MARTTVAAVVAGNKITAAWGNTVSAAATELQADLTDAVVSWTPTWTNLTLGNSTVVARYGIAGASITVWIKLTFGGTGSITGTVAITNLPQAATAEAVGTLVVVDTSVPTRYIGYCLVSGGSISPIVNGVGITSTAPMTWASTDTLHLTLTYPYA